VYVKAKRLAGVGLALALGLSTVSPAAAQSPGRAVLDAVVGDEACDPTDPLRCLLPFPNDRFTVPAATPTGLRVDLSPLAMPANVAGVPIRPDEWNRNDGFSPGAMALTYVPGLDLDTTFGLTARGLDADGTGAAQIRQPSLSVATDAPIVLLNATTGERHPYVAELDTHPDTTDEQRLLILRPLTNLEHGHRYVVALRRLRDADGTIIPAGRAFAAVRDHRDARPPRYQRMFADLQDAGVRIDNLHLAWDFTVASAHNVTGRALSMRDQAFARLGDNDLGDGKVAGIAPAYTITEVEEREIDTAIRGTVTVPNFLTLPQDLPRVPPDEVEDHLDSGVQQYAPGSRLYYGSATPGPMALPQVNPVAPTMEAEFACFLPHDADADDPARATLYGHGLLGSLGEVGGGSTSMLREDNHLVCATPWIGMSTEDVANVATILADMGNFPTLPDRAQQGFVNFLYLGRLLVHPDGFVADAAFQDAEGRARFDHRHLVYDGNSQGGIMGGALTALAPDFTRAVLGVPGANYSTLLNRSVDWEGAYGDIMYATYPDKVDQQVIFALIQMLWDRGEANGYAHFLGERSLPDTPSHRVLLHVAYADHQVANLAAEVMARTAGAHLLTTSLADGRHWADISGQRHFALAPFDSRTEDGLAAHAGSALVYIDSGNEMPPHGNLPPRAGTDPHGDPRRDAYAHVQRTRFFETGVIVDTRSGEPYWTTQCRGPHNPEACGDGFQPW
jgi:hypothetical protein